MKETIQEQLIAARRGLILDAAVKVFANKGFHATTIKDIAREAGIADGTIYNYFENKMGLMLAVLDRVNETERRDVDLARYTESDFRQFLQSYFRHRLNVLKEDNFDLFRVVMSEILVNQELREIYYQRIIGPTFALADKYCQQWADQHLITSSHLKLVVRLQSGMVMGAIIAYVLGDQVVKEQWDELPAVMADMILNGIGSHKA